MIISNIDRNFNVLYFLLALVSFFVVQSTSVAAQYSMEIYILYPNLLVYKSTCFSSQADFICRLPFACSDEIPLGPYFARAVTKLSGVELSNSGGWVSMFSCSCGDGVIDAGEQCDLPNWGTCQPYESCDFCQCHDFRNETGSGSVGEGGGEGGTGPGGCNIYDYCTEAPCIFGNTGYSNCYVQGPPDYQDFVKNNVCPDPFAVAHTFRTCPSG